MGRMSKCRRRNMMRMKMTRKTWRGRMGRWERIVKTQGS
jgi:hypothetical protein